MGWKSYITGDVYSGKDFSFQGSELYMTGYARTVGHIRPSGWTTSMTGAEEEISPISMPLWETYIIERIAEEGEDTEIIYSAGNISVDATNYETTETPTVICSSNGNITIFGDTITINGLIYAPNGKVTISTSNATINGWIVANEVVFSGSVLTVTASDTDLDFIYGSGDATPTPTPMPTVITMLTPTPTTVEDPGGILDSDNDGLPDIIELDMGYDINSADSDGDGVVDGDEDYDHDGLTNLEEMTTGTGLTVSDTDNDGISDGNEVKVYHTDPMNYDSDDDNLFDGEELMIGKNPLDSSDGPIKVRQTTKQIIDNKEDPVITSVDITMDTEGYIDYAAYSEDLYNVDIYSTDLVGRKGSPIGLNSYVDFDTATITFHYNDNVLGDTDETNLGVLWFEEESGLYIVQEQAIVDVVNNNVTFNVTHFSTYILVDLYVWNNTKPIQYVVPTRERSYDYIFALDVSQRMTLAARQKAVAVMTDFFENLRDGDRVAVCYFDQSYVVDTRIATNAEERDTLLDDSTYNLLNASLGGNFGSYYQALCAGADIAGDFDDIGNDRLLIILSNDTECEFVGLSYLNPLYRGDFDVVLALTAYQDQSNMFVFGQQFADYVEGDFYNFGEYGDSLWDEVCVTHGAVVEDWSDNDCDGITDFMETQGMMGTNKKIYYSDPQQVDSDDDGFNDGDEMGILYRFVKTATGDPFSVDPNPSVTNDGTMNSYTPVLNDNIGYVFGVISDPQNPDSDGDGVYDDDDGIPTKKNRQINYVVYGKDRTGESPIWDTALHYAVMLRVSHREFQMIYLSTKDEFFKFFKNIDRMKGNISQISDKKIYSGVDNLILVSHGASNAIMLTESMSTIIDTLDIENHSLYNSECQIKTIDVQACECASSSISLNFCKALYQNCNVERVYGWEGEAYFDTITHLNYVDLPFFYMKYQHNTCSPVYGSVLGVYNYDLNKIELKRYYLAILHS